MNKIDYADVKVGDTVKVTKGGTTIEGVVEPSINDNVLLVIGPLCIYKSEWDLVEHARGYKDGDVATFVVDDYVYAGVYDSDSGFFVSGEAAMFSDKCDDIKVYGNINE